MLKCLQNQQCIENLIGLTYKKRCELIFTYCFLTIHSAIFGMSSLILLVCCYCHLYSLGFGPFITVNSQCSFPGHENDRY